MKKLVMAFTALSFVAFIACKKDKKNDPAEPQPEAPALSDNYSSLNDFYAKNGVPLQTFTINAGTGGSYVSAQGTTINIPANTFTPATANIIIEFKDIYSKSDMLLSNMPTNLSNGSPLISAGQFYIRALNNGVAATADAGKNISVSQPFKKNFDESMTAYAYTYLKDSVTGKTISCWSSVQQSNYTLLTSATAYIHSIYINPYSPSWYNTDHPYYVPTTNMTLTPNQPSPNITAYLVLKNNKSLASAYSNGNGSFYCGGIPVGQECTMVAVCTKDSKLYASFKALTISTNQTITFDLTETTTEKFKADLKALD